MTVEQMTNVPTVKICGLQSVEVLKSMIHLPIDQIGFVFAKSKRRVSLEQAAQMIAYLREQNRTIPLTVGVFVNPDLHEVVELLRTVPLDVVQLHGQESPEFCKALKDNCHVQIYKAHSMKLDQENDKGPEAWDAYRGVVDAFLLDSYDPVYIGGSGKTFDWDLIVPYQSWAREAGIKLIVAGGLDPDNVRRLIVERAPDGVDVSSGVETGGVKDIAKVTAFVERVKLQ
ncbi:phosphoribosylanthranilate isomerase [Paenibacillus guangzhouensis]|uniref:phosphoribosylanthranilate isomerase n=1 Tax=Paenibacillus guangzhouensis TaxID=1473112 RepID=UPI001D10DD30|nr:phosphoribosylanthranilate isomerase [Paenibacillus guangzhouensis]